MVWCRCNVRLLHGPSKQKIEANEKAPEGKHPCDRRDGLRNVIEKCSNEKENSAKRDDQANEAKISK
jgi:hypothetical protein